MPGYVELQVTSNYSFLRGASRIEELMLQAKALGYDALAITDRNTLAGIARAHARAAEVGIRLVVGCRLDLRDGLPVLAYPLDRAGYGRLCRLLTLGKGRTGKGGCDIAWADLAAAGEGLLLILLPDQPDERLDGELRRMRGAFAGRCHLALTLRRRPGDHVRLRLLFEAAQAARVPTVVTGDVLYHDPTRRILQDVVTCIREGCTVEQAGFRLERFADRHLKPPDEVARLFAPTPRRSPARRRSPPAAPSAWPNSATSIPDELERDDETPQQGLERLVAESVPLRYPDGLPPEVDRQLRHELALIGSLDYAPYFLTVNSIVRYARSKGILCQGRGSAANSAVCYVLGVTAIDPVRSGLLFERFISAERREPPDIDVDFESERREEVIQWVYERYGRDRAALCATAMCFGPRGAIRDVGKVMGLTEDVTGLLASQVWGWSDDGVLEEHAAELNLNLADRRLRLSIALARELIGFPRQLGTHPGGFVLTRDRLDELVPVEPAAMAGRQVIEWDKDDIDALKFMKVDVLGLGMLGCLRRAFEMLEEHRGVSVDIATIPAEDPRTYAMIRKADTLGTFQIESRAQMAMLPRLKPTTFYDLVVQVAIVRPGPIQGDMVHPYLRRREGWSRSYPKEELQRVLGKTLGVPLFQEQAMQVAIVCAGFTPGEADQLRRSMATFKFTGGVSHFKDKLVEGMVGNGYEREFAERTFSQLEGFGSYGFPESHAASFALVAYASAWVKCHHPDVFCAALLNAQPMGFYAPAQIVRDAREHRVMVRPVCVNASPLGLHAGAPRRRRARAGGAAGAAHGEGAGQRARGAAGRAPGRGALRQRGGGLAAGGHPGRDAGAAGRGGRVPGARAGPAGGAVGGARAGRHGAAAVRGGRRAWAAAAGAGRARRAAGADEGGPRGGGGLPQRRADPGAAPGRVPAGGAAGPRHDRVRRPAAPAGRPPGGGAGHRAGAAEAGSAKGVMFITIEDETGVANLVLWADRFEAQRRLVLSAGMIACHGRVQREGEVIHVVTDRLEDLSDLLRSVGERDEAFPITHGRGDGATHPAGRDPRTDRARAGRRPVRDIYVPDLRLGSGIKVPTRDFR